MTDAYFLHSALLLMLSDFSVLIQTPCMTAGLDSLQCLISTAYIPVYGGSCCLCQCIKCSQTKETSRSCILPSCAHRPQLSLCLPAVTATVTEFFMFVQIFPVSGLATGHCHRKVCLSARSSGTCGRR